MARDGTIRRAAFETARLKLARVRVARASAALVEKGYLWVYRDRVAAPVDLEPGALVQVEDAQGHILGTAYFSNRSKIALRMFTRGPAVTDEALLWRDRIDRDTHFVGPADRSVRVQDQKAGQSRLR